jgi:predicted dehydrogenase
MRKVNVGVVGCGNISGIYFQNLTQVFKNINVYSCCDIREQAAKDAAEKWGIPHIQTFDEMLECDDVEIILNITTPESHYEICKRALLAGKHVYVEKPLSLAFDEGSELVRISEERGLLLGCAPDTFLGAGIQTCRKLMDDDFIGEPVGAVAFMMCHGHESWHPSPEFYYKRGGGPMFDMGPYYITALVNLMGGVREVMEMTNKAFDERIITSQPLYGKVVDVEVDTHVSGLLRFENGAVATIITSFDVWNSTLPRIEIYGTKGTLIVPDPNTFGGPVMLATKAGGGFREIPLTHIYAENSRGIGLSDMAQCMIEGRTNNRASGKLANHVLEIMCAIDESQRSGKAYGMKSRVERPEALGSDLVKGYV